MLTSVAGPAVSGICRTWQGLGALGGGRSSPAAYAVPALSVRRFWPALPPLDPWPVDVPCGSCWASGTRRLCLTQAC